MMFVAVLVDLGPTQMDLCQVNEVSILCRLTNLLQSDTDKHAYIYINILKYNSSMMHYDPEINVMKMIQLS